MPEETKILNPHSSVTNSAFASIVPGSVGTGSAALCARAFEACVLQISTPVCPVLVDPMRLASSAALFTPMFQNCGVETSASGYIVATRISGPASFAEFRNRTLEGCALETLALACLVVVYPGELGSLVPIAATDLDGTVDVYLAGLISNIVIAISVLDCSVDVDTTVLNRGVRIFGLNRYRAEQGHR